MPQFIAIKGTNYPALFLENKKGWMKQSVFLTS
jgi:hypothetical protein